MDGMGAPLTNSIADVLNTNASRAYFMMERHGWILRCGMIYLRGRW